ncbi:acyl-CoA dehydrogenase family protein [Phytohabitans sp. ZYX-F-186]|uniref:Acyl-CoA dehydrogenase family protein n=1 Tax=Phytohabitans maris TaxID=3071409 RepID=A0ABU0ZQ58_9ACTN|nr:acyl-CoA dehydrogenase family protein [Phytohabitans sp. ZYX-F-186]MDQ7908567.1 acyl-CoA dehydrogenase family protein [Phytohabitans sp. ZYX-F-186]
MEQSFELRRNDYSLSDDQEAVRQAFAEFFGQECPTTRVRAAEPLGHDEALWHQLAKLGAVSMALPEPAGGDGATLVDLLLVAEEYGRALAPVPLVEAAVTARLLATCPGPGTGRWLAGNAEGTELTTLALHPVRPGAPQLVPGGAVARAVVGLAGDDLVLVTAAEPPRLAPNQGTAPLAWWDLSGPSRQVLATGDAARGAYRRALAEWKVLTAGALAGLADAVKRLGAEFTKTRYTMGVPIGSLQGVAHPLADVEIAVAGARNLTRKAAWFLEHEPDARPELVPMAFAEAARAATTAAAVGLHVQGGFGFTLESDVTLHFRRAKGWSVLAGDPRAELLAIGDRLAATVH